MASALLAAAESSRFLLERRAHSSRETAPSFTPSAHRDSSIGDLSCEPKADLVDDLDDLFSLVAELLYAAEIPAAVTGFDLPYCTACLIRSAYRPASSR